MAKCEGVSKANATCLFITVGTTVPETVTRHIYGILANNQKATWNTLDLYHVPESATGTQYLFKDLPFVKSGSGADDGLINLSYPENPEPLSPFMMAEGGSKIYASSATSSLYVTVLYWDDILTGIEKA
jgi:hypothetical protein